MADAGLILPATLAGRLGLEGLVDEAVDLGARPGAARPGRKVMTLVHAILAGADCIDDCQLLRAGEAQAVLGHRVMAPSTLGTFLRSFTFGHVRQLDRVSELALGRAWAAGAGPGAGPLVIDLDSTICEVHGYHKQGAGFSHTRVRGYHPLLATRADTGEVLHLRMRRGQANTMRGAERFVRELAGRVRRAGASGPLTIRADSGFWAAKVIGLSGSPDPLLDRRALGRCADRRRHRGDPRGRLAADRLHRRRPRRGGRDDLPRHAPHRAPHPPCRRPGAALSRLAPPRLSHRPPRHARRRSMPTTAPTP